VSFDRLQYNFVCNFNVEWSEEEEEEWGER